MGIIDKIKKKPTAGKVSQKETKNVPAKKKATSAAKKTVAKKVAPAKKTSVLRSTAARVLVRPMLSEKTTMQEAAGQYTFVVTPDATKPAIKRAIKEVYGVAPRRVNIINVEGKKKRFGRFIGRRSDWKKAIVSLPKGKTIQIHEGV